jgi:hypothetical protein
LVFYLPAPHGEGSDCIWGSNGAEFNDMVSTYKISKSRFEDLFVITTEEISFAID